MNPALRDDPFLGEAPLIQGWRVLSPCVLQSRLGRGGMGVVFRGRHLRLGIEVAVKCLDPALASEHRDHVLRFQHEARLAASIGHQSLVRVYDIGQQGRLHYLVMEFIRGETLRERVRRKGGLDVDEALMILFRAAEGLGAAHEEGVIHRDIKPDNIMVTTNGKVKVVDLGLAKAVSGNLIRGTMTKGVMGTPRYMAPEQWESAKSVEATTDVWALGATLWFLLAGRDAIESRELTEAFQEIVTKGLRDIRTRRPEVPAEVAELVARATAKDAAQRPVDASALAEELDDLLRSRGRRPRLADPEAGRDQELDPELSPPPSDEVLELIRAAIGVDTPGGGVAPPAMEPPPLPARPAAPPPLPTPASGIGASDGLRLLGHNAQGFEEYALARDPSLIVVRIPRGRLTLGSRDGDADEQPLRDLDLPEFYIAKTPVTNRQYRAHCSARGLAYPPEPIWNTRGPEGNGPQHPVVQLSWDEALAFARSLAAPGLVGDLPREAEWEYAARGPAGRRYPWGDQEPDARHGRHGVAFDAGTTAVDAHPAGVGPFGLLDQAGNVWEWCRDWYGSYADAEQRRDDDPAGGSARVLRGGSFLNSARSLRTTQRYWAAPHAAGPTVGFRFVLRRS